MKGKMGMKPMMKSKEMKPMMAAPKPSKAPAKKAKARKAK